MILNISFTRRLLYVAIQIVSGFRISSCWPMTINLAGTRTSFVNGGRMIPWREYALFLWMVRISLAGKTKRLENALPKLFITIFAGRLQGHSGTVYQEQDTWRKMEDDD
ncbi:hypothetical protein MRB53_033191 [Persea americana]|uniref:Uncharacterized protein n=1 Tax=Persea americana TaxID=3435 RepID=A0ACC2KU28_PERAE|nr:hypothetical protein MRB53_033191 [Persea americana]